jgi:hypothetical protein
VTRTGAALRREPAGAARRGGAAGFGGAATRGGAAGFGGAATRGGAA